MGVRAQGRAVRELRALADDVDERERPDLADGVDAREPAEVVAVAVPAGGDAADPLAFHPAGEQAAGQARAAAAEGLLEGAEPRRCGVPGLVVAGAAAFAGGRSGEWGGLRLREARPCRSPRAPGADWERFLSK